MNKTLQVFEKNALKAFNEADENGKSILSNLFGKEVFSRNIIDRIKSMEDVYEINGTTEKEVIHFPNAVSKEQKSLNGCAKVMQIAKALNEGWEPNWSNKNERKYYPWFTYCSSGVGFSSDGYADWATDSSVGSRLCFKTSDLAIYAAKQFEKEYNEFLNS